jgi:hypothetical protein
VPVPCFLLFLCFRKATQEIFSELDETKAKPSIFPQASRILKMRRRGAKSQAHPRVARSTPSPLHQGWGQLAHLPMLPFRLYISLDGKNLSDGSLFLKTYSKPPPSPLRDREDPGAFPGTLPEAFSTTMVASGVMCE